MAKINIEEQEDGIINFAAAKRMSETEYERQREGLEELYGNSSAGAAAKRDQALADLFCRSGWTLEQLAKKEGITLRSIGRRMLFGRFLNFGPSGTKSEFLPRNLTERRFRGFWDQTDRTANEGARFRQVRRLMAEQTTIAKRPVNLRLGPEIMDKYADGKWHAADTIIANVEGETEDIEKTLHRMCKEGIYNSKAESKPVGKTTHYRIFKQDKTVSTTELTEKLGPIIKELKTEGRKNMATISVSDVARLAALLQKLLDEWTA